MNVDEALVSVTSICGAIDAHDAELERLRVERDVAWKDAADAGVTQQALADLCGVSQQTINLGIGRARGRKWAAQT